MMKLSLSSVVLHHDVAVYKYLVFVLDLVLALKVKGSGHTVSTYDITVGLIVQVKILSSQQRENERESAIAVI